MAMYGAFEQTKRIQVTVNKKLEERTVGTGRTLLEFLREDLGLIGTKESCGEGECGACTVLLNGRPVNSCLVLAVQADHQEVLTIEGLATEDKLDPIQQAFIEEGAIQCGFCTPGMVMASKALLNRHKNPTEEQIRLALAGNHCRCTGYVKIVAAVLRAAQLRGESDEQ